MAAPHNAPTVLDKEQAHRGMSSDRAIEIEHISSVSVLFLQKLLDVFWVSTVWCHTSATWSNYLLKLLEIAFLVDKAPQGGELAGAVSGHLFQKCFSLSNIKHA
ncbi:uncharacterized protein [Malus domestica]|uniref:uncharacterized protein isoform X1 n=1 Tax=Malus domestica TaxID=3750 RepID=UPI0039756445